MASHLACLPSFHRWRNKVPHHGILQWNRFDPTSYTMERLSCLMYVTSNIWAKNIFFSILKQGCVRKDFYEFYKWFTFAVLFKCALREDLISVLVWLQDTDFNRTGGPLHHSGLVTINICLLLLLSKPAGSCGVFTAMFTHVVLVFSPGRCTR